MLLVTIFLYDKTLVCRCILFFYYSSFRFVSCYFHFLFVWLFFFRCVRLFRLVRTFEKSQTVYRCKGVPNQFILSYIAVRVIDLFCAFLAFFKVICDFAIFSNVPIKEKTIFMMHHEQKNVFVLDWGISFLLLVSSPRCFHLFCDFGHFLKYFVTSTYFQTLLSKEKRFLWCTMSKKTYLRSIGSVVPF